MAFHLALAEISGNPLGVLIVRSLFEILGVVRPRSVLGRDFMEDTCRRHEVILSALASRDAERCAGAMAVDVDHTYKVQEARTAG
jgi:DNA-binding GntR family transcriptional regulator